jgi:hypothetical protein
VHEHRVINLMLMIIVLSVRSTYHKVVFHIHVRLVNFMGKLMNVCSIETKFADGQTDM